ncbi:hypothetical protein [Shewanella sp. Isolate11]|uniref:hypothetical protein n=1 Tax=Shewanella sp. Isolate11 TaxID=2908530 RepID=UPI001EFD291A|nr:hypothetical protein [Shewanella sp. Isolate11]MCG9698423.1 hypothetical protein [Shewanella sp. Isolate11]
MRLLQIQLILCALFLLQGCAETAEPFEVVPQTRALQDSDVDGVIDARDNCASTNKGLVISNDGCPSPTVTLKEDFRVVMFGFDKDKLSPEEDAKWKGIIANLAKRQSPVLYLVGDTSEEGTEHYNSALAKRRVAYIRQLALSQGFPADAIKEEVYYSKNHIPQQVSGREHRLVGVATWQEAGEAKMWDIYTSERKDLKAK